MKLIIFICICLACVHEGSSGPANRDLAQNKLPPPDMHPVTVESMVPLRRKKGHLEDHYDPIEHLEEITLATNVTISTPTDAKTKDPEEFDAFFYYFNWLFGLGFLSLFIFFVYVCFTTENRLKNFARNEHANNIELQTLPSSPSPKLGTEFVSISLNK